MTHLARTLLTTALVQHTVAALGGPVSFYDSIKPLFAVHCYKCHADTEKGGLRLDVAERAKKGGDSDLAAIVPGDSSRSELIHRVTSQDADEKMPPKGVRLTQDQVALLARWIDEGANWPARDDYWAFQSPREVAVPDGTAANPIDRFLDATLSAAKLTPRPKADPRTLLRRMYFDLLGVPPTPAEALAYLTDQSPSADEKLVERLLADARYGERWGRYWLDLVRYGESDGYEDDKIRPHAWRYRDYVIRSLNADKPYDRFVQEQIAGDELWPDDPDAWTATGFARLGAWDGMSKEPEKQRQDFLNDMTDTVGAACLGVTLGCARCHDHKYDVITQRDYYATQAFFAGVKRETREMNVPPPEPASVTEAFKAEGPELKRLKSEREELLREARTKLEEEQAATPAKKKIEDDAVKKRVEKDQPGRLGKLDAEIKALESLVRFHEPVVEAVSRGAGPHAVRLLKGGELSRPGEEVAPAFVAALRPPDEAAPAENSRAAFARWITSPDHPLTPRVLVNRLWQHHFGTGLVATPSDFGRNGKRPSHPELLDWLARRFVADGWSINQMHRLIMMSDAYRRASTPDEAAIARDPENRLLWRMTRRRLESEAIRDTILTVSGTLNPTKGGPGVYAALPKGVNIEFPNNDKELSWGTASTEEGRRRSVYLFQRRSLTFPLMEVFDAAPMNQSCAARPQTTVAPQALALFNGEFTREAALHFAGRLQREAGDDCAKQIEYAFQLAFTREPSPTERESAHRFLQAQTDTRHGDRASALSDFCHVLLNANELIYPD